MYNTEVREQLQVSCDSSAHTLALDTIIGKKSSCDYITSVDGYNNIMDKIAYGAIEYNPTNINPKGTTEIAVIKNAVGTNALTERILGEFDNIVKTTRNARRHLGWLMQGKTKTLEIIRDIITSFINNLRLFLEKDFLHFKSKIQKKYEDYELCADYVSQTITSLIGMLSLAHGI